jgi:hypothetical protein
MAAHWIAIPHLGDATATLDSGHEFQLPKIKSENFAALQAD